MPVTAKTRTRAKATPDKARVAVVGGGIAGMTCALKLARSGCQVTIYEAKDGLGGNLSSAGPPGGPYQDVYPHIFPDWYANFWALFEEDLGLRREDHFAPRWGVKVLDKPAAGPSATEPPRYMHIGFAPTPASVLKTLNSGVLSAADFFLFTFLNLDLTAQPPDPNDTDMLCQLDVNGFFYSRNYSNDAIAALQDFIISVIWSIPSDMTSAKVYKQFIKHQLSSLGPNTPYSWMLKGSIQERIVAPLEALLRTLGCSIETGVTVRSVEILPDGAPRILLEKASGQRSKGHALEEAPPADYVVMAVPGPELARQVMRGPDGQRLVDKVPDLAHLRRTRAESIPVVNLHFTRKLPFIPEEIVGLRGSGYDLTVLDISQLWDDGTTDATVLVVAASNFYAIPSEDPRTQAYLMIKRLREYLSFDLGEAWGEGDDIDWKRTTVRQNEQHRLFVNDVGSRVWRPGSAYPALSNVFFAGDACRTDVDMATVEAAVESGVLAAQAVQQAEMADPARSRMSAEPIEAAPHRVLSDATFLAAKLALLPLAYTAAAWSAIQVGAQARKAGDADPAYATDKRALLLPLDYAVDWWRTAYWLQRSLRKSAGGGPVEGVDAGDEAIGLGVRGLWASGDAPRRAAGQPPPGASMLAALGAFSNQLAESLRTVTAARQATRQPPPPSPRSATPKEARDGQGRGVA